MNKVTRFRANQLGEKGVSFLLAVDNDFTLIESRLNDCNRSNVINADIHKIIVKSNV